MKKIEIIVTENNINNGEKGYGATCPIALAVRECLPNISSVFAGNKELALSRDAHIEAVVLPNVAQGFISLFDNDYTDINTLEPFSFTINVPEWAL